MIKITPEVFAVAVAQDERRFLDQLAAFLRQEVPELAGQPPAQLDAQLRLVVEQARAFGFRTEQGIAVFTLTAALLGPDFADRFPAARAILTDAASEAKKAEQLETFTTALFEALDD